MAAEADALQAVASVVCRGGQLAHAGRSRDVADRGYSRDNGSKIYDDGKRSNRHAIENDNQDDDEVDDEDNDEDDDEDGDERRQGFC